jgi:hypothetical protein
LHLPVDDLTPPDPAQLDAALDFIDERRARGERVAVHCLVGQGRTGTVLAAYLIRGGLPAEVALREIRAVCRTPSAAPRKRPRCTSSPHGGTGLSKHLALHRIRPDRTRACAASTLL